MSEILLRRLTFWSFGLSGLAALMYEVVWFRALSLVVGSTTYAMSTMLATFMAGLSIGSYLGGVLADRAKRPVLLYAYLEGLIAITALVVLPLINVIPPLYAKMYYTFRFSFAAFSVSQFFLCFLVIIVPTVLMGATFPVVCRIFYSGHDIGSEMGKVYAVNTVGAIAGSLVAGFVLIPSIGLKATNLAGASINLAIALVLIVSLRSFSSLKTGIMPYVLTALFSISCLFVLKVSSTEAYPFNFYMGSSYNSYNNFWIDFATAEKLFDKDDSAGNVKVLKLLSGKKAMVNNGKIESDNDSDLTNLAVLAYLPLSVNPDARSFLNIGLGTGATIHYAAKVNTLEKIYSVEISPATMEASRLFFYPDIFNDSRVNFITADARNYLSIEKGSYDVISSEPSYPVDQGFSQLYSREFFDVIKGRLNDGGVFCQWVPRYIFRGEEFKMILKTFQTVFPEVSVWRVKESGDFLLTGGKVATFNTDEILKSVGARLEAVGLPPTDLALVSDRADVESRMKDYHGPINTDDNPIVEFIGARRMIESIKL